MQARIMAGGCAGATRRSIVPAFASLLLLAFLTVPAAAQDGPRHAAIAKKAAVALAAHLQEIAKAHRRPDYGKPPLSQYLQRIFDDAALVALPPAKGSDISWLLDWSEQRQPKLQEDGVFRRDEFGRYERSDSAEHDRRRGRHRDERGVRGAHYRAHDADDAVVHGVAAAGAAGAHGYPQSRHATRPTRHGADRAWQLHHPDQPPEAAKRADLGERPARHRNGVDAADKRARARHSC